MKVCLQQWSLKFTPFFSKYESAVFRFCRRRRFKWSEDEKDRLLWWLQWVLWGERSHTAELRCGVYWSSTGSPTTHVFDQSATLCLFIGMHHIRGIFCTNGEIIHICRKAGRNPDELLLQPVNVDAAWNTGHLVTHTFSSAPVWTDRTSNFNFF